WSSGQNLAATTKHGRIFNQSDFLQIAPAPRRSFAAQHKQLADIGQQKIRRLSGIWQIVGYTAKKRTSRLQMAAIGTALCVPLWLSSLHRHFHGLFLREPRRLVVARIYVPRYADSRIIREH